MTKVEEYRLKGLSKLTPYTINQLVQRFKQKEQPRLKKMKRYYEGESDINKRTMNDPQKPNNKIDNNFAGYITDTINGYFIGRPITYRSKADDLMADVQEVLYENHEETHNARLARDMSIYGVGYELLWVSETAQPRIYTLNPENVFAIYNTSIKKKLLAVVHIDPMIDYSDGKIIEDVTVYTPMSVMRYVTDKDGLMLKEEETHSFMDVPVVIYKNNDDLQGDFEKVIPQIDAYNKAISNTANDYDYFSDSYMVIESTELDDPAQINTMKEARVIQITSGNVKWLTKDSANMGIEEYKDRLKEDIVLFSGVPDLTSEAFGSNLSSIAIRMKLFALEQKATTKENNFTEGIQRRLELIVDFMNVKRSKGYNYQDISFSMTRNLPVNLTEEAQWAGQVRGLLSDLTILSNMSNVSDPQAELDLREQEDPYRPIQYTEVEDVPEEE